MGFVEPGITGQSSDFANCPVNVITSAFAFGGGHCLHSYTTGGVVQIGHSSVPISIPGNTFDAGQTQEEEAAPVCAVIGASECVISPPHGILHGPAQPVPGGLLGTVGNVQLTGVSAMFEWAASVPPNTPFGTASVCGSNLFVTVDLCKLLNGVSGTDITLSVKIHLMSPFLGANCYIGSAAHPIVIPLTTGLTNPPPPAKPIHGKPSEFLLPRKGALQLMGTTLVSNSFSVPVAKGCGTSGGSLVDASINRKLGLPSAAGLNLMVINANSEEHSGYEVLEAGWTGA
ncbi:MAG TPA: hypothetical protein VFY36_12435 [Solirubrobacteraceae bacterium]|nr:hypothetical protein [Solirubrobacteraceae bacterium]